MSDPIRVLYVDDYALDHELVRDVLEKEHGGFCITEAASRQELEARLAEGEFDLVLSDFNILGYEGLEVIEAVRARDPRVPVVMVTGTGSEVVAVEAMRHGAADYVIKSPEGIRRLPHSIQMVMEKKLVEDERKRAEEALRESEEKFRSIVEQCIDGIILADEQGTVVEWNRGQEQITGLKRAEAVGRPVWDVLPQALFEEQKTPAAYEHSRASTLGFLRTGQSPWLTQLWETDIQHPDGTRRSIQAVMFPIKTGKGFMSGSISRDVTERKRSEEELRQRTAQLETLRQMGLELTTQLDLDSLLRSIVSRAVELLGGVSGSLYLYRADLDALELAVSIGIESGPSNGVLLQRGEGLAGKVLETGESLIVDDYQYWEGRATVWEGYSFAGVVGVPVCWSEEFLGVLDVDADPPRTFSPADVELLNLFATQAATAIQNARLYEQAQQEITERKRAEEALQEYSERLEEMVEERAKELRDAQEQLIRKEKLAVIGQMAASISHELRNPLGAISNAAYYLQLVHPDADETTREYLGMISDEVRRATRIISSLLDFSRTKVPDRQKVAVSELVAGVLRKQPAPENVQVTTEIASDLLRVYADPYQMEQVLGNLIVNAYQAMPEGGSLTIGAQVEEGQVAICVADTGLGISQLNMARLFGPLFTTKSRGLGLGLAVVKTLMEANGGSVEVESEEEEGSTFTIRLPVVSENEAMRGWGDGGMRR